MGRAEPRQTMMRESESDAMRCNVRERAWGVVYARMRGMRAQRVFVIATEKSEKYTSWSLGVAQDESLPDPRE